MNGQQLHRVLVVPASVAQPKFHWLIILDPETSGVRAGKGDKRPRASLHTDEEGAGRRHRLNVVNRFCHLYLETLSGSDREGYLLELISRSKSFKRAFSKSQQYKALFSLSFKPACKYTEVYISMCCWSVAAPVFAETDLWEFYNV